MSETNNGPPTPPEGLGPRGHAFWRTVHGTWILSLDETELLVEVCRQLDVCEALAGVVARDGVTSVGSQGQVRAHPAVAELRAARLALSRLVAQLGLPDPAGATVPSAATQRGRTAARARWGGRDATTA